MLSDQRQRYRPIYATISGAKRQICTNVTEWSVNIQSQFVRKPFQFMTQNTYVRTFVSDVNKFVQYIHESRAIAGRTAL